jgi:S-adenosylmethionine synthetase
VIDAYGEKIRHSGPAQPSEKLLRIDRVGARGAR